MDSLLKLAVALGITAVGTQCLVAGLAMRELPAVALSGGGLVALVVAGALLAAPS